jgi:hypothetical protein
MEISDRRLPRSFKTGMLYDLQLPYRLSLGEKHADPRHTSSWTWIGLWSSTCLSASGRCVDYGKKVAEGVVVVIDMHFASDYNVVDPATVRSVKR